MNIKKVIIGILLIIGMITILYLLSKQQEEKYFTTTPIDYDINFVMNETEMTFLDTIAYAGMKQLGLESNLIKFIPLSDKTKEDFKSQTDSDLKAHIIYQDKISYIYIDKMTRDESVLVMSHEFLHIKQYDSQRLKLIKAGRVIWLGDTIDVVTMDYNSRPWEIEAFKKERSFRDSLLKVLY
jgi:hypothetical protein